MRSSLSLAGAARAASSSAGRVRTSRAGRAAGIVAALAFLAGCQAGPATKALEAEEVASVLAYRAGAEEAVAALRDGYRAAAYRELAALAELDARDAGIPTTEFDAEGKATTVDRLSRADALKLVTGYAAGRDQVDAEVRRFEAAWEANRANLADALRLRDELRRWLERSGLDPAQVAAAAEGIAAELEKRR